MSGGPVLLTGATGYVGGRLLDRLEARGLDLRCLARRPEHLRHRESDRVTVHRGDVLDAASLDKALGGCRAAYYLVHAMGARRGFAELERQGAENFARAARAAGLERIIYLGGLGAEEELSAHLASRQQTGRTLGELGPPLLELRASIVIGAGSLSFEMIRSLVERLPLMTTPRWVRSQAQPIFIDDLLDYLVASLELPGDGHRIYEIGGSDVVSYGDLMREYARQRGLRRLILPVPVLSPGLSSLWLGLVTPLYARVGRKLADSLRHSTVIRDPRALDDFPLLPRGMAASIAQALADEERDFEHPRWSDSLGAAGESPAWGGQRQGSRLVDLRSRPVPVSPEAAFDPIARIGGRRGWYYGRWLWKLRGGIDLLFGGVGLRRGRRHPRELRSGDVLDWWRVEACESPERLRLRAEMRLPGRAWLEFQVEDQGGGSSLIRQIATFEPRGLPGLIYWYGIWPVHQLVFRGMLRGIARAATASRAGGG